MQRACHAIVADEKVWFVDPVEVDDVVDRGAALGTPAGVLQLLDRHNRDCAAVADRLGIEILHVPDEVPGSPFEAIPVVRLPGWKETALWWPETRALVVAEVVGTNPVANAGRGGVGMHPDAPCLAAESSCAPTSRSTCWPVMVRRFTGRRRPRGSSALTRARGATSRGRSSTCRAPGAEQGASTAARLRFALSGSAIGHLTQVGCQYSRCSLSEASGFQYLQSAKK